MRLRRGQVAIYLVAMLVGIVFLVLMNVGAYLSVAAKNRAMNAGDAAALAVARHQGELVNRIGRLNEEHLRAVLDRSRAEGLTPEERAERLALARANCERIREEQSRICFLSPLDGIAIGNEWARKNGISLVDEEAEKVLRQHVVDIRTGYQNDLEEFPEPWEGAWSEYATKLEALIGGGLYAAPDNIEFVLSAGGHLLLNPQFYNAIAGRNWCWFHFNAPGIVEEYESFRDWGPLPLPDDETRRRRCANSEIYSLHLVPRVGSALTLLGREEFKRLAGCTEQDINDSELVFDAKQTWYFYDTSETGYWRKWWEIDPEPNAFNDGNGFPVVGTVRPEYDVRGCSAVCRVRRRYLNVVFEDGERFLHWTAAAKPFGTLADEDGAVGTVTARNAFVLPAFDEVRLVPLDSVGGNDSLSPSLAMMDHVNDHLPDYLVRGVPALRPGCYYCNQLVLWEMPYIHEEARRWLKKNAKTCVRSAGTGGRRGGTGHAH